MNLTQDVSELILIYLSYQINQITRENNKV